MKRRPSLKGRSRLSDAANAADQYPSTVLDPSRAAPRKRIEYRDSDVTDGQRTWDWEDADLESVGQQPRR